MFLTLSLLIDLPLKANVIYEPEGIVEEVSNFRAMPVVRWTAGDDMDFRLRFIENLETSILYTAVPETGTFSHHGHIEYFNEVFYAAWDSQIRDENGSGQRTFMRRSTDRGKTWLLKEELFPSLDHNIPTTSVESLIGTRFHNFQGFVVIDNVLYALADAADWAGPSIRERSRNSLGRLCRKINSDGTLGEIFWLRSEPPQPINGFPSYQAGDPLIVEKINNHINMAGNEIQLNFTIPHPTADDGHRLNEPTQSWRLDDGTWVRLYRDMGIPGVSMEENELSRSRRNYAAFSFNNGTTWTVPTRTSFPDACARSDAGRLPDGQVYIINNILPISPKQGGRALLAISLSRDGLNFDRTTMIRYLSPPMRYQGRAKSVGYQYPHSVVAGEYLWVIYSVNKEDIQLTRIPLDELYKLK